MICIDEDEKVLIPLTFLQLNKVWSRIEHGHKIIFHPFRTVFFSKVTVVIKILLALFDIIFSTRAFIIPNIMIICCSIIYISNQNLAKTFLLYLFSLYHGTKWKLPFQNCFSTKDWNNILSLKVFDIHLNQHIIRTDQETRMLSNHLYAYSV